MKYHETTISSFEQFMEHGLSWCWSLVGNIVQEHEFGEEHEIKPGTKQFSKGNKISEKILGLQRYFYSIILCGKKQYKEG